MTSPLVAVVTGASAGIGRGIAEYLAGSEYHVVLVARRATELNHIAAEIRLAGGSAEAYTADLAVPEEAANLIPRVLDRHGTVDLLVNSAGVVTTSQVHELDMEAWDYCMALNLRAPAALCAAALPSMRRRRSGRIVNICSEAGMFVYPEMGAYCVSKHALRVLTQLIQDENQELGIKAWAICPGDVATERTIALGGNHSRYLTVRDIVDVLSVLLGQPPNVKLGPEILLRTTLNPNEGSPDDSAAMTTGA